MQSWAPWVSLHGPSGGRGAQGWTAPPVQSAGPWACTPAAFAQPRIPMAWLGLHGHTWTDSAGCS